MLIKLRVILYNFVLTHINPLIYFVSYSKQRQCAMRASITFSFGLTTPLTRPPKSCALVCPVYVYDKILRLHKTFFISYSHVRV